MGCMVGSLRRYLILIWLATSIVTIVSGWEETRIAWRCSAQPEDVDVGQLEKGFRPASDYITLGEHIALVDGGVYGYTIRKGHENDALQDSTRIDKLYYPVFSTNHPLAQGEDPARPPGSRSWSKPLVTRPWVKCVRRNRRAPRS